MLDVNKIESFQDAQYYVEGIINDFESGISTKGETMQYLGEYTARLMVLFWENAKKKIKEDPTLLDS